MAIICRRGRRASGFGEKTCNPFPVDVNFPGRYAKGWRHPEVPGGNLAGWVKVSGRSPIVYLQNGHDARAWENTTYKTMLSNAIKWSHSKEAKAWAAANAKTGTPAACRPGGTNEIKRQIQQERRRIGEFFLKRVLLLS